MAAPKRSRIGIGIDMTPMVDIGFLLVIFFMSTYHARPPETVGVDLPLSRSPFKVPESDVMILTILPPDRAFTLTDSIDPTALTQTIAQYELPLEEGGKGLRRDVAIEEATGEFKTVERKQQTAIEAMSLTPEQRKARADSLIVWWNLGRGSAQPIPFGSLSFAITDERIRNPRLRLVIKADKNVESGLILQLMEMLQNPQVNMLRFSMMTTLEAGGGMFIKTGG
jgi:biopolymer transport protein ExbD